MPQPNFFIVGVNKGGTTSLHAYLSQHPQVAMGRNKEPMFFRLEGENVERFGNDPSVQLYWTQGIFSWDEYLALFDDAGDARAIGEASTAYMAVPGVADRIHARIPDAKIIAVLRHPVERAFSNYRMYARHGLEPLPSFDAAIEAEPQRLREGYSEGWSYVGLGLYYENLKRYFELFGRDQVRVYLFDADLQQRPREMLKDIFRFLGIDESFEPDISTRLNTAEDQPLARSKPGVLKRIVPQPIRQAIRSITAAPAAATPRVPEKQMSPQTRQRLIERYRPDILKLQDLLGRDLSHWLR